MSQLRVMSGSKATGETRTVLVIDDNQSLADGFARVLSTEYDVRTAYTGEQACELFGADVDAVLLDRKLPDASGDDLLAEMRDSEHDCGIAIVSATTRSSELDCDIYLTKPVSEIETIRRTVDRLVEISA